MVVPDSGNVAIFDEPGPYSVSVGDQTVSKLFVRQGDVSFISGVLSALAGTPNLPSYVVGDSEVEPATLSLSTLDLITEYASIGFGPIAVGTVNIDDSASSWNSNWITVGDSGHGTLNVSNGTPIVAQEILIGRIEGSQGEIHYTRTGFSKGGVADIQADSTTVGLTGEGVLRLEDTHMDTGDLFVGTLLGATGTLEATSSKLISQDVSIGLGTDSFGTVLLQGDPVDTPSWTSESLSVGDLSEGKLVLRDGNGIRVNGDITLGSQTGSNAEITVTGRSSSDISSALATFDGRLVVGGSGLARLNIEAGGLCVASEVMIGESPIGDFGGFLEVRGRRESGESSFFGLFGDLLNIGGTGTGPNQITGALSVEDGAEVNCKNAKVGGVGGSGRVFVGEDSEWQLTGSLVSTSADATVHPPVSITRTVINNYGFRSQEKSLEEIS